MMVGKTWKAKIKPKLVELARSPSMTRCRPLSQAWPRLTLADDGEQFLLEAVVPGLTQKDITLTLSRNVLTISGERQLSVPEGYDLQRRERGSVKFSRSVSLPGPVDPEKVDARVKDGLLTVSLARAEEARPRRIAIESA